VGCSARPTPRGDMTATPEPIIFAGGGTGGTIGPGLAIAERLRRMAPDLETVFLCSERAIDASMLAQAGVRFVPLPALPPTHKPLGAIRFLRAWHASRKAARPLVEGGLRVVSLGGFVAPPVAREAHHLGVPVTLLNLDARVGKANRYILRFAQDVITSVPADLPGTPEPLGVPLRNAVLSDGDAQAARRRLGLDPDRFTLLVTGASQGSASLNRFMAAFARSCADQLAGWQVLHLAGRDVSAGEVESAYAESMVSAVVMPFLEAMGDAWAASDLVLTRGGASSIAELAANRVPGVVAPFPWHKDQHQAANAAELLAAGGVVLVEDHVEPAANLESIAPTLRRLLGDQDARNGMQAALEARPQGDAAEAIARRLLG
ncbi:MAG: UDP-N-acetylglucosamine--N-acetylmuramyl-(pentapeptide) pyrophosphoryl-undecaprenol N-acetylglucosamine transferase, partial [Phycisphaerales bacterium]|nr:UDP-N-acetylglucosamine--N-acetylmuramyl-(pentapeptide) pyrophosphoryl-undecaprenol N-acetylglucosamine transferase [Phycisphaerales bacterium]